MKYTKIEVNDNETYSIYFTNKFYDIFTPYYQCGSYFNILYRLFGLLPQDFYHMAAQSYNATFQPNPYVKKHIRMQFKNKADAIKLCNEIDSRISYFTSREGFI